MSDTNWLARIHDGQTSAREVAHALNNMGSDLRAVGMDKLADRCHRYSDHILQGDAEISAGLGELLQHDIQRSGQNLHSIFASAFAGAALASPPGMEREGLAGMAHAMGKGAV